MYMFCYMGYVYTGHASRLFKAAAKPIPVGRLGIGEFFGESCLYHHKNPDNPDNPSSPGSPDNSRNRANVSVASTGG